MRNIVEKIIADPRYKKNVKYGEPRPGHPEGTIEAHIAEVTANLEAVRPRLKSEEIYWKLLFLIHIHDIFKAESVPGAPICHPQSHASLARKFAAEYTDDTDLLNMVQFHDEGFALWTQFRRSGNYDTNRFHALLTTIKDWDLFLLFTIVDGATAGKDRDTLAWFINEVRKHQLTEIDDTWIP